MMVRKTRLSEAGADLEPIECDLVVSLGTNCEVAYNLRAFYGIGRTGLFDWLITPLSCLPSLIQKHFALVDDDFGDALVRVDLTSTSDSVMHAPTGILLHHAFTRDKNNRIPRNWRAEIGAVADKFSFLGRRMDAWMAEARSPALFIKGSGWHEVLDDDLHERCHQPDTYTRIIDSFRVAYPASDPLFCLLNAAETPAAHASGRADVRLATVGNRGDWHEGFEGHFGGCKTAWSEVLASMSIQAPPPDNDPHCRPAMTTPRRREGLLQRLFFNSPAPGR